LDLALAGNPSSGGQWQCLPEPVTGDHQAVTPRLIQKFGFNPIRRT
ncbi:hypothetical protein PSTT_00446, partial [Puccinia striiformis]